MHDILRDKKPNVSNYSIVFVPEKPAIFRANSSLYDELLNEHANDLTDSPFSQLISCKVVNFWAAQYI